MKLRLPQAALLLTLIIAAGCGRPSDEALKVREGMIPVKGGAAAFGTTCNVYATVSDPTPVKLGLWNCPLTQDTVTLTARPKPLLMEADCHKMQLKIRSADSTIDTLWNLKPDGSVDVVMDKPLDLVAFSDAGASGACSAQTVLGFIGKVTCAPGADTAAIQMEVRYYLNLPTAAGAASGTRTRKCELPKSCFLSAESTVHQCE